MVSTHEPYKPNDDFEKWEDERIMIQKILIQYGKYILYEKIFYFNHCLQIISSKLISSGDFAYNLLLYYYHIYHLIIYHNNN